MVGSWFSRICARCDGQTDRLHRVQAASFFGEMASCKMGF
jgi:hypothetical protein